MRVIKYIVYIILILLTIYTASATLDNYEDVFYIRVGEGVNGSFVSYSEGIASSNVDWITINGERDTSFLVGNIIKYEISPFNEIGVYRGHITVGEDILNVKVSVQNKFFHFLTTHQNYVLYTFIGVFVFMFIILFFRAKGDK